MAPDLLVPRGPQPRHVPVDGGQARRDSGRGAIPAGPKLDLPLDDHVAFPFQALIGGLAAPAPRWWTVCVTGSSARHHVSAPVDRPARSPTFGRHLSGSELPVQISPGTGAERGRRRRGHGAGAWAASVGSRPGRTSRLWAASGGAGSDTATSVATLPRT